MPALLLNTNHIKMRQSYLHQKRLFDQSQAGNSNAVVPLVLAFGFFGLFLIISLWFLIKNKNNSTVPSQQLQSSISPPSRPVGNLRGYLRSENPGECRRRQFQLAATASRIRT